MPANPGAKRARRLVLVRHGETEWSRSGQHTSVTDLPLTTAGEHAARALATVISALRLHDPLVVASPRQRATHTASLAGLAVHRTWEALTEWNYGAYEGLTTEQIRVTAPGWTVWTQPCPGGETPEAVTARADEVLATARAQLAERDVVLVGHGHFWRALLARWAELPVVEGRRFMMSAGGVSVLGFDREVQVIMQHNIEAAT